MDILNFKLNLCLFYLYKKIDNKIYGKLLMHWSINYIVGRRAIN